MSTNYDSMKDTETHILSVAQKLNLIAYLLTERAGRHDASKLQEPEKSAFDHMGRKKFAINYDSEEYKAALAQLQTALAHHYEVNTHHPQHWPKPASDEIEEIRAYAESLDPLDPAKRWLSAYLAERESRINGMSLLDVLEMFTDWKAAGEDYKDGNITQSLEVNKERFGISDQLFAILQNTVKELGWE